MQFEFDGKRYRIAFERQRRSVNVMRGGRVKQITSKHPFTTVKVYQLVAGEPPTKAYEATVGCFTQDTYSHREGAKQALRALTELLQRTAGGKTKQSKDFRRALWQAYINR